MPYTVNALIECNRDCPTILLWKFCSKVKKKYLKTDEKDKNTRLCIKCHKLRMQWSIESKKSKIFVIVYIFVYLLLKKKKKKVDHCWTLCNLSSYRLIIIQSSLLNTDANSNWNHLNHSTQLWRIKTKLCKTMQTKTMQEEKDKAKGQRKDIREEN